MRSFIDLLHFSGSLKSVEWRLTTSRSTATTIAGKRQRPGSSPAGLRNSWLAVYFACAAAGKSKTDFRGMGGPPQGSLLNVICDAKKVNHAMLSS